MNNYKIVLFERFIEIRLSISERSMDYAFDVTVIGAGVIGLSVASYVSRSGVSLCLVERHSSFGQETSSRNSEVVHSGIHYPPGSLKARFCVRGRELLYELCAKHDIPFRKTGKLIVAGTPDEAAGLEELLKNGRRNGVEDLALMDGRDAGKLEPNVRAEAALFAPSTGIVDSHGLMKYFERRARADEAILLYNADVVGLEKEAAGFRIKVHQGADDFDVQSRIVVNCAGLQSDSLAALAGIDIDRAGYRIHACKGEYFSLTKRPDTSVERLIYPPPRLESGGLGVHITVDLQGQMKLGPNTFYVESLDYNVDPDHLAMFYESARTFLPGLHPNDLQPAMAGIRPKLQRADDGFRDFVVRSEEDRGLPGLINLIGIESPGLTSAPAIGDHVARMVDDLLKG